MDEDVDRPSELTLFDDDQAAAAVPLLSPGDADRLRELQQLSPDERLQGLLNAQQLRAQLEKGLAARYTPREPCGQCGATEAELRLAGDHHAVYCRPCGSFIYHAPKAEVGIKKRSVANLREGISASRRARIFDRDHGRCVLCGDIERLVVGHLLSVADGEKVGATRDELFADVNLAAMCETCNAGLGERSLSLLTVTLMHYLLRAEMPRTGGSLRRP